MMLAPPVRAAARLLDHLAPVFDLLARLYVAKVFFKAGLVKIQSWSATLSLFENEYAVPLLPSDVAAYLGTGVELFFPVLLALGLAARPAALIMFVFNIVAVVSYPDISPAGVKDHMLWGALLAMVVFHGPGKWSLDHLVWRHVASRVAAV